MPQVDRLYVTVTERCNMRCPHCWISAGKQSLDYPEITDSEITDAIEELLPLGLKAVKLTGGEPLVRKDLIYHVIRFCLEHDLKVSLETNAVLLDDRDMTFLSGHPSIEIGVSLDYSTPDQFDHFRVSPGAFGRVTNAIRTLSKTNRISTAMAVHKENLADMEKVADLVVDLGGKARYLLCVDMGRADENMQSMFLTPEDTVVFYKEINRLARKYPGRVGAMTPWAFVELDSGLRVGMCEAEKMISLLPDGSVCTCGIGITQKQTVIGNVRSKPIADIIDSSSELCLLRQRNDFNYKGVCGQCMFESVCANRCPAHAYDVYGSYDGPYPVCQRLFDAGLFPREFLINER